MNFQDLIIYRIYFATWASSSAEKPKESKRNKQTLTFGWTREPFLSEVQAAQTFIQPQTEARTGIRQDRTLEYGIDI